MRVLVARRRIVNLLPVWEKNRGLLVHVDSRDLRDSTHSGLEGHGNVRVQCHPWDGLVDGISCHH